MKLSLRRVGTPALAFWHAVSTAAYYFPADDARHLGTLLTWPTKHSVFKQNITATRIDIANIAHAIGRHESVKLFVYNDTENLKSAWELLGHNKAVSIFPTFDVDSLWARDTGPIFVRRAPGDKNLSGVVMHFNQWGNKLPQNADDRLAKAALEQFDVPIISAGFTGEGGALEHDGEGTMMATESSLLNPNRNPGLTKPQLEAQFAKLFGIKKTIWFKGSNGTDITDAHVDGLARFVAPGLVALTRPSVSAPRFARRLTDQARHVLSKAKDAKGRRVRVVEVPEPDFASFPIKSYNLCIEYVNWYTVNGAVILAAFGDEKADANAKRIVQELYPDKVVEQVLLRELLRQGGGIHCSTQQIPASKSLAERLSGMGHM